MGRDHDVADEDEDEDEDDKARVRPRDGRMGSHEDMRV